MKFDTSELGNRIRMYRGYRDMTQGQLSEMIGVNITTICKYEDGSTTPGRGQGVRHRGRTAMHAQRSARLEIAEMVAVIR